MRYVGYRVLLSMVMVLLPAAGYAALGENPPSTRVEEDVPKRKLSPSITYASAPHTITKPSYQVTEYQLISGITVKEFSDAGHTVFAVYWRGPSRPDLQALLGSYYPRYQDAIDTYLHQNGNQRHARLTAQDLVIEIGGTMRNLFGFVYVPSLIPAGLSIDDIR